jgi:hypothetical protein
MSTTFHIKLMDGKVKQDLSLMVEVTFGSNFEWANRACPQLIARSSAAWVINGSSVREEGPMDGATVRLAG